MMAKGEVRVFTIVDQCNGHLFRGILICSPEQYLRLFLENERRQALDRLRKNGQNNREEKLVK